MHPAGLAARLRVDVAQGRPDPERAVAGDEPGRLREAAPLQVAQHARPRLGRLAVAVLDREQLLGALLADADHDQQAELGIVAQAHGHVDAVDPQVAVALKVEPAAAEGPAASSANVTAEMADSSGSKV